ncbi:MAG: RNase J family beta-CASP ribonuclease [Nanoarchaeota archaeon]|nr:MAG: RNase J family beta-CASP ribonuclease [Nanoarchaeota archaeon]
MPIEICTVSGYNEVGKNMTAINVDGDVIICDMGLHMENYVRFTEDQEIENVSSDDLLRVGAIPDMRPIEKWRSMVKAIIPSHAHLDHIGAIPYLSNEFHAPILCTPFTAAVIQSMIKDRKTPFRNQIRACGLNSIYHISKNITVEFVGITHSTPHSALICIHTKYGTIIYANDFKLDLYPTLGDKVNFSKLRKLGQKGVLVLICESTYASLEQKMPSESVARQMLMDVLLGTETRDHAIIVTTFSSHIARLKAINDFGRSMGRKVIFMGRSIDRYLSAAEKVGIVSLSKKSKVVKFSRQIVHELKRIDRDGRGKYVIVVTGHMGEPKAVLSRIARGEMGFKLKPDDQVIFSNRVIPTPTTMANREALEREIRSQKVRIFKDIHVSGHAAREDLRDMIDMLKPRHIIPSHGDFKMTASLADLAHEMGYVSEKTIHIMQNGEMIRLP